MSVLTQDCQYIVGILLIIQYSAYAYLDAAGSGVIATQDLLADQTIVSCPFSLVIDQDVAKTAIGELIGDDALKHTESWSARQWISTYIAFHWIVDPADPRCALAL